MEDSKIYLIGNAHLDPVWLWQWQEGFAEIKATFRSALDRMYEFDDFKFTSGCSVYYMWIEKSDKKMFDEIVQRVKEGRWCIVGGWFLQPDCNIPCGESFARHSLVSQRYFKEKFGVFSNIGYNVDSFGHNGNIPQILKNSRMDKYVFMRPAPHEKDLPSYLFNWESMDGSSVKTYRIPEFYNIDFGRYETFEVIEKLSAEMPMMAFYGVGNHGGGPTVELLDYMHKNLSDRYIYSTPEEYFDTNQNLELPTVRDDLQFHAKGCYSAMSEIKANNRLCENKLYQTEAYSVLSNKLIETNYPEKEIDRAWNNVLFNQFHDIMGGCCIKEAYDDARHLHHETLAIADRNINFALQQISWNVDTMDGREIEPYKACPSGLLWRSKENIGTPVVVFNPLPYDVSGIVSVRDSAKVVTDDMGNIVPIQSIRDSKTNVEDKYKTAFIATVPALGYSVYRMYFEREEQSYETMLSGKDNHIENEFLKVEFDCTTGEISAIYDKKTGENILNASTGTVLMDETDSDTWAHDIKEFKKCVAKCKTGNIKVIETGPIRVTMRSIQQFENTHIIRDYSLLSGQNSLFVNVKVDFHEKHRMLKFSIPADLKKPKAICEIPFGYIERPTDGSEQVMGAWAALMDENKGISVVTTSKYSFDAEQNVFSLTVLRGAIYADHFGKRDEFCEYMEQGEHEFSYTISPYESIAVSEKKSRILNNPLTAIGETFHKGRLKTSYRGIHVSKENIVVTAIKKRVDSEDIILRCYETENRKTKAKIQLFDKAFEAEFGNNEIKTFIISGDKITETDFLEY